MRLKSSHTLVFTPQDDDIAAYNFLSRTSFSCTPDLLALLTALRAWTDADQAKNLCGSFAVVAELIGINALIEEGSALALAEEEFQTTWRWGVPAALYHFSLLDRDVISIEAGEDIQRTRATEEPQPAFFHRSACDHMILLPPAVDSSNLLKLMAQRRTVRTPAPARITFPELANCLFAGLGVTGRTENCVGALPLSMAPSGGARHPYEAYIYARAVDGLAPGFYHYMADCHCLTHIPGAEGTLPAELLGGQTWANDMPCIIFLCAWFERTMWKYDDANAYRVVMIEAGHIGQNIMLAATEHGLSACPTAALNHSRINACLVPEARLTHSPVYALALGRPAAPH